MDELAYASASGVTVRTQRRKGQILAGLVIAGFAVLGYSWLQITGTALFLLLTWADEQLGVVRRPSITAKTAASSKVPPFRAAIRVRSAG